MTNYVVTGKLGTGKGKFGVERMRSALWEGRRVATNFDLYVEHLLQPQSRKTVMRVPDRPTAADLDALGHGNPDSYDEDKNGVLVLDELSSWLNARAHADKGRAALIDWLVHSRKKGWDVYMIVQHLDMIDKQIRLGLAEYVVKLIRADRLKIPVIGTVLGKRGRLPRFHVANYTMADIPGVVVDRDYFRGDDLHKAYDTRQVFREWARDPADERFADETYAGPYSYLSPWHLVGRHAQAQDGRRGFLSRLLQQMRQKAPQPSPKPKHPLMVRLSSLPPERATYWAQRLCREGLV